MKKKSTSRSAFFSPRVLIAVLLGAAVVCSTLTGTLLAFFRPEAPTKVSNKTLTFEERVAYQRAIEEVYWRHRIWPKERPDPKPSLDAVMSQAQLEKNVAGYLRESQALADYWQRPITAEQLQAEMDRMAQHTKQPEVLRELFEALGKDPFVIVECLARPALAERNLATIALRKESLDLSPTRVERQIGKIPEASARYTLPTIPEGGECVADTWTATSIQPEGRSYHTVIWTGSEMIVWGGLGQGGELNTDWKYNPSVTSPPTPTPTPIPYLNTGARYSPNTDSWTDISIGNAPDSRAFHTAVWTGNEMIVWGGIDQFGYSSSGGRYNPIIDSWTATATTNAPDGREHPTAVWTGTEMIVWGGTQNNGIIVLNTGGKYNPSTDTWIATTVTNAPAARFLHTAVWSGNEMVVWGGVDQNLFYLNTGGKYNPGTDSWTATNIINAPSERAGHTAIWTGNEMIVWGGYPRVVTGGRYNPGADSWTATSSINAPPGRDYHTAIWTGSEMIVWGGQDDFGNNLNTGGRYCAQFASPTPSPTPTATPTSTPTATPRPTPTPRPRPSPPPRPTPR